MGERFAVRNGGCGIDDMANAIFNCCIQQILVALDVGIEQIRQIVGEAPCQMNDRIDALDCGSDEFLVGQITATGFDAVLAEWNQTVAVAVQYAYFMAE